MGNVGIASIYATLVLKEAIQIMLSTKETHDRELIVYNRGDVKGKEVNLKEAWLFKV